MQSVRSYVSNSIVACIGGILALSLFGACGVGGKREDTSDIAEIFYDCQTQNSVPWPAELFAEEEIAQQANDNIARREMEYGALLSYKKVASNKRVSVEAGRRIATATYIFEITCENGRTREILTISKDSNTGSFHIIEYIIEEIRMEQNSLPLGTSTA